jgi:hypothetical protein
MDSNKKDKSDLPSGATFDHLTVNHIEQKLEKQFTVNHLQQRLDERGSGSNTQTHEQGSGSNTQTQQGGGETSQKKD